MTKDLLTKLRRHASSADTNGNANLARMLEEAAEEIERCHVRLEIDHVYRLGGSDEDDDYIRVNVPYEERMVVPDAVDARDMTISCMKKG